MKIRKIKTIFFAVLVTLTLNSLVRAEELKTGMSVNSSGRDAGAIPEQIRDRIVELSKGVAHREPQFLIVGKAQHLEGDSYRINGDTFLINKDTVIFGDFKNGSYVEARGQINKGAPMIASQVVVSSINGDAADRGSNNALSQSSGGGIPKPESVR